MIHGDAIGLLALALIGMFACSGRVETGSQAEGVTDDGGVFACGSTATCDGRSQVCEHVQGGVPPGVDFYACIPIPAACAGEVDCTCVTTALKGRGANECSAAGGNVIVQIDVP
jgi:hypothetical protein